MKILFAPVFFILTLSATAQSVDDLFKIFNATPPAVKAQLLDEGWIEIAVAADGTVKNTALYLPDRGWIENGKQVQWEFRNGDAAIGFAFDEKLGKIVHATLATAERRSVQKFVADQKLQKKKQKTETPFGSYFDPTRQYVLVEDAGAPPLAAMIVFERKGQWLADNILKK